MKFSLLMRRRVLATALLAATCAATALAQSPATSAAAPIRIGMIEGLSGPFANTGEAVYRNLVWATERVNARGGVKLPGGNRPLVIERFDSKGQTEEALSALRSAIDRDITIVTQGNSSAAAAGLIDAINKHNERDTTKQVLFLNYSAVDPVLTNQKCSYWHFRFDAHADMRMSALMSVLRDDKDLKNIYLIGQDYSFGQAVLREARSQLAGNWGNDLTLLVKAAREAGFDGSFYTFYGNALGAPAAIGDAGIGKVVAVADWFPNVPTKESEAFYQSFRQRFPNPADDYVHMRMQLMVESLAQAIERAGSVNAAAVAAQLEKAEVKLAGQSAHMRAADHQFQQPLAVAVMDRQGAPGVKFDVEGSGYGFRVVRNLTPQQAEQPHSCNMVR